MYGPPESIDHTHRPRPLRVWGFTTVEALVAVALVGTIMGGLLLGGTSVAANLVQGAAAERTAASVRRVSAALYRMMEVSTEIYVTPTLNHDAGVDWDWGPFTNANRSSRASLTVASDIPAAHLHLAAHGNAGSTAAGNREVDPTVPFYDLRQATARELVVGNGYLVWFVRADASILGVLAIEKTGANALSVSLYAAQGNTTLEGTALSGGTNLLESYSVEYEPNFCAAPAANCAITVYRKDSAFGFPTAPVDYALLQSVRQFGPNHYGSTGHHSGTLILLPSPYDLDAVAAPTKMSLQGLAVEHATPVFVYAHPI